MYRANTDVEIELKPKYSIKQIKEFVCRGLTTKKDAKDKEKDKDAAEDEDEPMANEEPEPVKEEDREKFVIVDLYKGRQVKKVYEDNEQIRIRNLG